MIKIIEDVALIIWIVFQKIISSIELSFFQLKPSHVKKIALTGGIFLKVFPMYGQKS